MTCQTPTSSLLSFWLWPLRALEAIATALTWPRVSRQHVISSWRTPILTLHAATLRLNSKRRRIDYAAARNARPRPPLRLITSNWS